MDDWYDVDDFHFSVLGIPSTTVPVNVLLSSSSPATASRICRGVIVLYLHISEMFK